MAPILIQLDFHGTVTPLFPGVLLVRAHADNCPFGETGEAFLESRLSLVGDTAFEVAGTIGFGELTTLRYRTIGLGVVAELGAGRLRSGAAICELDRGSGALEGAAGRITSNFVISESGEVSDHQVGLIFAASPRPSGRGSLSREQELRA